MTTHHGLAAARCPGPRNDPICVYRVLRQSWRDTMAKTIQCGDGPWKMYLRLYGVILGIYVEFRGSSLPFLDPVSASGFAKHP